MSRTEVRDGEDGGDKEEVGKAGRKRVSMISVPPLDFIYIPPPRAHQ